MRMDIEIHLKLKSKRISCTEAKRRKKKATLQACRATQLLATVYDLTFKPKTNCPINSLDSDTGSASTRGQEHDATRATTRKEKTPDSITELCI